MQQELENLGKAAQQCARSIGSAKKFLFLLEEKENKAPKPARGVCLMEETKRRNKRKNRKPRR